jgi:FAD/FMN-containing dehydrogenase
LKVLTREEDIRELSRDSGIIELRPVTAYVASSESDVVEALSDAKSRRLALTPRGAGTSIPSQSVGRGIILLQDRKRATVAASGAAECEPALTKSELNGLLDPRGLWMPVDPSSYLSCSVGGMVANNSSGSRSYKYGSTIEYVEELHVALPEDGLVVARPMTLDNALSAGGATGEVARLLVDNVRAIEKDIPRVTKNSSGYRLERVIHDDKFDLPRLFVGSEGTLGVVTQIRFSTRPKPPARALLIFETNLAELDGLVTRLRTHSPSAVELLDKAVFQQTGREEMIMSISRTHEDYIVFAEFEALGVTEPELALEHLASDSRLAGFEPMALTDAGDVAKAWGLRNETLTNAADMKKGSRSPVPGVEDLVVPPEKLGELIRLLVGAFEQRGLEYISYGHAGDANLHMRPLLDRSSQRDLTILRGLMEECFEAVWRMGGSITGEHGDGMLRAPYVRRQHPHSYDVMKEVKRIYDPKRIMNPGVKIV